MSNIVVTHAPSGLVRAQVARTERVTPHMMRVTLAGPDLDRLQWQGFDQWVRLAVPVEDETRFDNLPARFGMGGYLRYLTLPRATRPVIRNYTLRAWRRGPDGAEVDVDFVVHGDEGIAGPWAVRAEAGEEVAMIDQGCGWRPTSAGHHLLIADESGLPAVAGVLRDLSRDARGTAIVELFDEADRQDCEEPEGVEVHWVVRSDGQAPGDVALATLRDLDLPADDLSAFAVGEQALATGARRHLVNDRGVPKQAVTFSGYWRLGRAAG